MKYLLGMALCVSASGIVGAGPLAKAQAGSQPVAQPSVVSADQENATKARALLDQAIQALGGPTYLSLHARQEEGRTYSFHHGQPTSNGVLFWRFVEYPDKERVEVTKERDVAYLYVGNQGYELTYKGPHPIDKKEMDDYLRRRRFSLDIILREWTKDPGVALFYVGNALAGNLPAQQITMISPKNEAVDLYFDPETHLPIKKSYTWRDPVDRERNVEEEIFDNYRLVQGVMTAYGFTRYFNGDMQTQRFVNAAHYNENIDQSMFDPNSHYDPNKTPKKR